MSKLISGCRIDLPHLKRKVALSLLDDHESSDSIPSAELNEALSWFLITAAEEAFPFEFKSLNCLTKLSSVLFSVAERPLTSLLTGTLDVLV